MTRILGRSELPVKGACHWTVCHEPLTWCATVLSSRFAEDPRGHEATATPTPNTACCRPSCRRRCERCHGPRDGVTAARGTTATSEAPNGLRRTGWLTRPAAPGCPGRRRH